jgi:excisionase family DNA binding protein
VREELQVVLQIASELPYEELPSLLGELEELRWRVSSRYTTPASSHSSEPDRNLGIKEAARQLNVSKDYLYRHKDEFCFTRKMGRKILFSSAGLDQYIRRQSQQTVLTAKRQRANLVAL